MQWAEAFTATALPGFSCDLPSSAFRRTGDASVALDLLDVVHQTEALPLGIDLAPPAQGQPIQPLGVPEVTEDRFDDPQAPAVLGATDLAAELALHLRQVRLGLAWRATNDERHWSPLGPLGMAQALRAQRAVTAGAERRSELNRL